jgi:hypothetical protein
MPGAQPSDGALLFRLLSMLYDRKSVIITTNPSFSDRVFASGLEPVAPRRANAFTGSRFGDSKRTSGLLDRRTHRCHILQTRTGGVRFRASAAAARSKNKGRPELTQT